MVVFKLHYGHSFFYCFHCMSFVKDIFREFGLAFCVSEVFFLCSLNLVLKFLLTVSVAAGACQFVIFKSILRDYVNHIVRRNLFGISLVIK